MRLRTDDEVTLAGWYVPSANRAAVVVLHGAGPTRSDVLGQAAVLNAAGFGVLMVDARGRGDSGGRAMDFGWHGDRDIAAATAYLARRPDVDAHRIGAVGMSMGGEEALGATATNDALRAVVAEGATTRAAADEAWLSDRYGLRGGRCRNSSSGCRIGSPTSSPTHPCPRRCEPLSPLLAAPAIC